MILKKKEESLYLIFFIVGIINLQLHEVLTFSFKIPPTVK